VGIDLQACVEHQLCVPAIEMNVESYRRRTAITRKPKPNQQPAETTA
jgi:hypothetical protein